MSTVAVIGLGYGGSAVAKELANADAATVIGINEKPFVLHNIASLRALADISFVPKLAIPLDNIFVNAKSSGNELVIGHASVERDADAPAGVRVTVDGGRQFRPDYVVIATGSSYNFPGKATAKTAREVQDVFTEGHEALKKATRVAIIGGGAVGVELAGEIRHYFPEKKVTIIQSGNALLSGQGLAEETQQSTLAAVEKHGIQVVFDRVSKAELDALHGASAVYLSGERVVRTETGKEIPADLVYITTGNTINNSAYSGALSSALGPRGRIEVNEFLQVKGFDRVFAIGDAAYVENMMAYTAGNQATNVIENIQHLQKGEPLKPYQKLPAGMAVTLGPDDGTGEFGGMGQLKGEQVSGMKGKGMFVDRFWQAVNAVQA